MFETAPAGRGGVQPGVTGPDFYALFVLQKL